MSKDEVQVTSIEIRYPDGKSKKLSIEDARKLHEQLEELFGNKTVYLPQSPVVIRRDPWRNRIIWQDSGTMATSKAPTVPTVYCHAKN